MKLLLTGATGAAGLEVLRAAIADTAVSHITVLTRRALPPSIPPVPKAHVVIHKDFLTYPPALVSQVKDYDAIVWALGAPSGGMSEADYTVLTHDLPMAAINAFRDGGMGSVERPFRFVFISGEGADQEEKSMMMFGRIKGRTERHLQEFAQASNGTMKAHSLRPGYFFPAHPDDRMQLRSTLGRITDTLLAPLANRLVAFSITPIEDLGKIAVEIAKGRYGDEEVFRNTRMRELMGRWKDEL